MRRSLWIVTVLFLLAAPKVRADTIAYGFTGAGGTAPPDGFQGYNLTISSATPLNFNTYYTPTTQNVVTVGTNQFTIGQLKFTDRTIVMDVWTNGVYNITKTLNITNPLPINLSPTTVTYSTGLTYNGVFAGDFAAIPIRDVPEIDPTFGTSAFALIAGSALIIRGRRKTLQPDAKVPSTIRDPVVKYFQQPSPRA